ncbi:MAG: histidine--tRNA ligase family protein [Chloroflexi bacterium]|nr:histidine--tRNA ligase family protein [Chloroflexota bacterium]
MGVQRAKGTQDLSPEDMRKFRLIEGVFRDCCLKWGYEEVRTPTLEYLHLFTSTGTLTPSRLGKVYSFLDWDGWSGERVVLRPDGTIPIARLYIEALSARKLAKLFYVTNVFSFEETGKESREKWQCGVELIGAGSTVAEVELVLLALGVLKQLGLQNVELRLSHADLIRALLAKFGLSPEEQHKIYDRLLDGDEAVLAMTKSERPELGSTHSTSSGQALATLLEMKGKSSGFLKNLKALFNGESSELEPALSNFIDTVELLESVGVDYHIDLTSGRGFEYYTGLMFKLLIDGEQIGGGGRYDHLIPLMGGKQTPASGFALYLDHLMKSTKVGTLAGPQAQKILIRAESGAGLKGAFKLAATLHEAGHNAEVGLGAQPPANYKWLLDVRDKAPHFVLTDRSKRKKFEAQTAKEVLKLLG